MEIVKQRRVRSIIQKMAGYLHEQQISTPKNQHRLFQRSRAQKNRNRNGHLHDRAARRSGLLDLLCASNYVKLAGVSVLHPSAFLSSQSSLWYAWCTIGFALSDWTRSCGLHSLGVPDSHPRSQVIRPLPSHNMSSSPLSNC
jgi:hypothetical protein